MTVQRILFVFCVAIAFIGSGISADVVNNNKATDEYVAAAQNECFASKRIISCFRYKAARYLWAIANGRMNLFQHDNARVLQTETGPTPTADDKKDGPNDGGGGGFHFVQLSEPSSEMIFPGARQLPGDSETENLWKFAVRSVDAFINSHGFRVGINGNVGARVLSTVGDDDTPAERTSSKRKKWQIIVPLAILAKLIHLKTMVMKVLFGIGTIQVLLVGGGILLYYYLKHNTICKIEPHLIHSHSHVSDASLPIAEHSSGYESPYPPSYAASSYASGGSGSYVGGGGGGIGPYVSHSKGWDRAYSGHYVDQSNTT